MKNLTVRAFVLQFYFSILFRLNFIFVRQYIFLNATCVCQICCRDCVHVRMNNVASNSRGLEATAMDAKVCLMMLHRSTFKMHLRRLNRTNQSTLQVLFLQMQRQGPVAQLVVQTCLFNGVSSEKDFIRKYT